MFNYYLPQPIYDRLPLIYLGLAMFLAILPLAPIKWVSVAALLLALAVTNHWRQTNREDRRLRKVTGRGR